MKIDELLTMTHAKIAPYQRVLVAYSGGVDSSVLLHLLVMLRDQRQPELAVRAVYIHHGLSQYADEWAQHCLQQCQHWQVPLEIIRVNLDQDRGNIEAAARDARYQAFTQQLAQDEVLLTAQHLDDQCETFFLAVKRGSGPAGLSAMNSRMPFARSELIRPLLDVSRQRIEDYAQRHGLRWVEDESNQSARFDRNFLRLAVLPQLSQRWPHFAEMTARSAQLCAEQEQLLDELLAQRLAQCIDEQGAIDIEPLKTDSEIKRYAILRRWLASHQSLMPSREQLQRLWYEVALARQDAEPQLQLQHMQIRRFQHKLYLLPFMMPLQEIILPWDMQNALWLPDNLGILQQQSSGTNIRKPLANEQVTVRFRAQGQFRLVGRTHARQIKKIWQELGVAPWQRQRTPLIYYNEQLIAAVGVFVTREGQALADSSLTIAVQ